MNLAYLVLIIPLLIVTNCGGKSDDDAQPGTVYGNLTLSDSKSGNDNATLQLTNVQACARNADTGRVDVILSQGENRPSLSFAIKDYSSDPRTYECKQAADNATSETSVGGKFETCMIAVMVPSAPGASTLNGYSMYRESAVTKPFVYTGSCSITVSTATPSIAGSFVCADMVQTVLDGAARNPMDNTITARAAGDFSCTFR